MLSACRGTGIAGLHRSTAHRQLTAARLQDDYPARIADWNGRHQSARPSS
ncbi:hypothetical protein [Streptomyces gilvus]|nr:hypothetical protein [Streptomyces sp. CME 23]MCH5677168.1 hypothetical protein [Streptomyces sp. CME 23]